MGTNLSLKVKSNREELDNITEAIEGLGLEEVWPPELLYRVNLVIEELVLNIMDHGHEADDTESVIDITLTSEPESVTIEISDDGFAFDPLTDAPLPDIEASVQDRQIGGLGIHFARTLMDEFTYRREDGRNHLTLVTQRTA